MEKEIPPPGALPAAPTTHWPWLMGLGGVALLSMGLLLACLSLAIALDPISDLSTQRSFWIIFLLVAVPMLLGSVMAIGGAWRWHRQRRRRYMEQVALSLAQQQGGILSASTLALHSSLELSEAQRYLEKLAARGICDMEMDSKGITRFVFDELRALERPLPPHQSGAGEPL